jgi:hypothetical protein
MVQHENGRDDAADRRWSRRASIATVLGIPVALVGLVLAYLALRDGDDHPSPDRASALRLVDVRVKNGEWDPMPQLDVTLHNVGTGRAVLTGARIVVRKVTALPTRYTQGDLPVTGRYGVLLPPHPASVDVPLHQQIGADRADRLVLRLRASRRSLHLDQFPPRLLVYQLQLTISDDGGGRPLDAGLALVSVPSAPIQSVNFWPADPETQAGLLKSFGASAPPANVLACWQANTSALRAILDKPGKRSPELAALRANVAESVDISGQ